VIEVFVMEVANIGLKHLSHRLGSVLCSIWPDQGAQVEVSPKNKSSIVLDSLGVVKVLGSQVGAFPNHDIIHEDLSYVPELSGSVQPGLPDDSVGVVDHSLLLRGGKGLLHEYDGLDHVFLLRLSYLMLNRNLLQHKRLWTAQDRLKELVRVVSDGLKLDVEVFVLQIRGFGEVFEEELSSQDEFVGQDVLPFQSLFYVVGGV